MIVITLLVHIVLYIKLALNRWRSPPFTIGTWREIEKIKNDTEAKIGHFVNTVRKKRGDYDADFYTFPEFSIAYMVV